MELPETVDGLHQSAKGTANVMGAFMMAFFNLQKRLETNGECQDSLDEVLAELEKLTTLMRVAEQGTSLFDADDVLFVDAAERLLQYAKAMRDRIQTLKSSDEFRPVENSLPTSMSSDSS